MSSHHHLLQLTLKKVVALFQPGMDESALMAWLRAQADGKTAGALLETIASHEGPYPPTLVRALQCLACTARPIQTEFNGTHYEWAGTALQRLFKSSEPISEFWPFFSGSQKPAVIAGTALEGLGYLTLEHLVSTMPEVLGPAGADPEHHQQKYFFVKFLDPSDFPHLLQKESALTHETSESPRTSSTASEVEASRTRPEETSTPSES